VSRPLDRDKLLAAFDEIGRAAAAAGTRLEIAVYGGFALMLASNFRFRTEDADVAPLAAPWPDWLRDVVDRITIANDWATDWFNDGVAFHLSPLADHACDHLEFGTFPRDLSPPGLIVSVPSAEYLLAMKLKAIRVTDPDRGEQERLDILNLMRVLDIRTIDDAIAVLARYFPISAAVPRSNDFC
jgi:hypothetical protein